MQILKSRVSLTICSLFFPEALDIKKSYYEVNLKKKVQVIVCIYTEETTELMEEMKKKYFAHLEPSEVKFCVMHNLHIELKDPDSSANNSENV